MTIENYPYPFAVGSSIWEMPCMVPSDWEAQHLHGNNNPVTVESLAEDFVARHRNGEEVSVEEYAEAHPELADEIRDVLPAMLMKENVKQGAFDMTGAI